MIPKLPFFLLLVLAMSLLPIGLSAQITIFQEDFDGVGGPTAGGAGTYSFPTGWLKMNVDNRTPNAAVAYVNEAWERREDFSFNVADSAAFSTSWYTPAGAADDWMWTPPIAVPSGAASTLSWNAVAYDPAYLDGYSVRVMVAPTTPTGTTGSLGNMVTNSTQIFTVAAENSTWTARTASLAAYAGQTIRIAFRNTSNDKFLLLIDDVTVTQPIANDVAMLSSSVVSPYTIMPESEITPFTFSGKIRNVGTISATTVSLRATVLKDGIQVYQASSTSVATLAPNDSTAVLTVASYTPVGAGVYTITLEAIMSATDQVPANNSVVTTRDVEFYSYARDNGSVVGGLGIGAGNGGYLGNAYTLPNAGKVGSVGVYYTQGYTGRPYGVAVFNTVAGVPTGTPIYTTIPANYPDDSARYYTIPFPTNINLASGEYVFAAVEFDSTLQVGNTNSIFTTGKTWVQWPTSPSTPTAGGWLNTESFGASFAKPFVIRPNFCPTRTIAFTTTNATCNLSNGASTAALANVDSPLSYLWSNGATTAAISNVSANSYTCTITDGVYCKYTGTATITTTTPPTAAVTGTNTVCAGTPTSLTASGGGTYLWSNAANTAAITVTPTTTTTYIVTVTGTNTCTATANRTVTVNAAPTAAVTGTNTVCAGTPTTLTASGGGTYLWSNAANTAAITVTPTITTTYTVTVTGANTCTATANRTVTVDAAPTAAVTGTNTVCPGASTSLTASGGGTYLWSNAANTATISVSPTTNTTYTVTVTGANTCTATANRTVTINAAPTAAVTGTNTVCAGASTSLSASGGGTYLWSNAANTATISVSPTTNTTYTVTVTGTNSCTATADRTVSVNTLPSAAITGPTTICIGLSATLSVSIGNTYLWSNGATTASITVSPTANTTYSVVVTSAAGCTASSSQALSVSSAPTAVINGPTSLCNGSSATLSANGGNTFLWSNGSTTASISVSPSSNTTYSVTVSLGAGCTAATSQSLTVNSVPTAVISGTTILCSGASTTLTASGGTQYAWSDGSSNPVLTVMPTSTTTYTVTVTNSSNCTATAAQPVTVNSTPTAVISGNSIVCEGSSTTLTASGGATYLWSNGSTNPMLMASPTTNTVYSVTVTGASGCSAVASQPITVNTLPTAAIAGNSTVCNGTSATLTASGGASYLWSDGSTNPILVVTPTQTSAYTVTVTGANGCSSVTAQSVTVNALPTAAIAGNSTVCNGSSTTLTASGGASYLWSDGSTNAALTVSPTANTNYSVVVTSAAGCSASAAQLITVNALPTAAIAGNSTICNGSSTTLTASGGTSYLWSDGSTNAALTVSPTANTNYSVVVTSAAGCSASAAQLITVNALPTAAIAGNSTICNGSSTTLTASGGASYLWSDGSTNAALTVSPTANTNYSVVVTSAAGCSASAAQSVTVNALPIVTVTNNGGTLDAEAGFATYQWLEGGNAISGATAQTYTPTATGNYSVQVTNANACSATSTAINVPVGTSNVQTLQGVSIYPNPTSQFIVIELPQLNEQAEITITNTLGQIVHKSVTASSTTQYLPETNGLYFVQVKVGSQTAVFKVVKQ